MDSAPIHAAAELLPAGVPSTARILSGRLDGLSASGLKDLERHLAAGGSILVAPQGDDAEATRLAGVAVARELPDAEWFVTLDGRPEAARLDLETAVGSRLRILEPRADDVVVAATSSIGLRHRPVIAVRPVGRGRVVASGVADLERLLAHPTLGRFVTRLLRTDLSPETAELGIGVVGYGPYGGMGYTHGLAAAETAGLRLVAAADTVPERLDAARGDFPDIRTYPDAAGLAADDRVDIAIVATPPSSHARVAMELLRAGRHVVIEKPMCLTVADAERLIAEADHLGRVLTVHQSRRWDRDFRALQGTVARGAVGEVFNIETFVGSFEHPCRVWHSDELISGGAIFDWGSHHVDWILRLYGSAPTRVTALGHKRAWLDVTNADQVTIWMHWPDGREATFRQSDLAAIRRPKFYVQGTRGTIEGHYRPLVSEDVEPGRGYVDRHPHHAEAPVTLRVARYEGPGQITEAMIPPAPSAGWGFHRNLADHLLLGEPLAVPPAQSRDVVAVLEAAHRSAAAGGQPVNLD